MAGKGWGIAVVAAGVVGLLIAGASDVYASTSRSRDKRTSANKKTSSAKLKKPAARPSAPRPVPVVLDDPDYPLDPQGKLLAIELGGLWTRDPGRLVSVLQSAVKERSPETPLTLLLAIAHAETNGRVLLVSEAGAVGLAQATPIAYLEEKLSGKLFVTDAYTTGARAYFLKKPLNDVERIARMLKEPKEPRPFEGASRLLHAAVKVRGEGLAELELLAPYSAPGFVDMIRSSDRENRELLEKLAGMIERRASRDEFTLLHDQAQTRYRSLRDIQKVSWKRYQAELTAARDTLLRDAYGQDPAVVIKTRAYEASELLARELDDRFSPRSMAGFLVDHMQTKLAEARALGFAESELERMTAGLYNGGGHNVKRMMSGLITNLPETQNYMRKVPATRERLDRVLAQAGS